MLFEHQEFSQTFRPPRGWQNDSIIRDCDFAGLVNEGGGLDGVLIGCVLREIDWYWGLFNTAKFLHTKFENCIFRGASFRGCELVRCDFKQCRFILDNLGGACTVADCCFVESIFDHCDFVLDGSSQRQVFAGTRWYGCTQTDCVGLAGLF